MPHDDERQRTRSIGSMLALAACFLLGLLMHPAPALGQVTPGVDLEFNAAQNPLEGTDFWYPIIDTLPFAPTLQDPEDTSIPREYVNFTVNQSFTPVNDPGFPGISGSYSKGGSGRAWNDGTEEGSGNRDTPHGWSENINDPDDPNNVGEKIGPWEQDGTFEVWFKADSLNGGQQAILEWGGGGRGAYFSLVDDQLAFFVNGSANVLLSTTLPSTGWHQMVGTYHNLQSGSNGDDYISLYLDGQFVSDSSETPMNIVRWSGGNTWGVGEIGASNNPIATERADGGPLTLGASDAPDRLALDGEIAIVRYYNDEALTPEQVLANFKAVTGLEGDFNGNGTVDVADYALWRDSLGSNTPLPNDGGLGTPVRAAHYDSWKTSIGNGAGAGVNGVSAIPEPATIKVLLVLVLSLVARTRCRSTCAARV